MGQSLLPWIEVDITNSDIGQVADDLADWLESTGGLYQA
jgi:hypothetical protein